MATLDTIEANDMGRRVRISTDRFTIVGDLGDFSVDWIATSMLTGDSQRTVAVEVGGWSGRLPIDTPVEWL